MIRSFRDLEVWNEAMDLAMRVFEGSKRFPPEERYSMTDQIRRSSRSIAASISEAWHKRRYPAAFVSKLSDAEAEAGEVQTWIELAKRCRYWPDGAAADLDRCYENLIGKLVNMMSRPQEWCSALAVTTPSARRASKAR